MSTEIISHARSGAPDEGSRLIDSVRYTGLENERGLEHARRGSAAGKRGNAQAPGKRAIWFDSRASERAEAELMTRLSSTSYTGVIWYPHNLGDVSRLGCARLDAVVQIDDASQLDDLEGFKEVRWVVAADDVRLLAEAARRGHRRCLRASIEDAKSLDDAIAEGRHHDFLLLRFRDPTNIPLELVIASLQRTNTTLLKEIPAGDTVEDAIVALGVMEFGADGVVFSPSTHQELDAFLARLAAVVTSEFPMSVGRIVRTEPIGMGHRSCLDLTTLFSDTEGMLIGSTSQGGLLCCPEVFFLPYMELRPFRVNAGAVHSYAFGGDNRTSYLTELRAGATVRVVDQHGRSRPAAVGRVKTEVRPLRLLEAEFQSGERVNVIMQDDWHVRIFSDAGKPLNITELKVGDRVLGHLSQPGRHVGIQIDEQIVER